MSQNFDSTLRAFNPRSSGGLVLAKNNYFYAKHTPSKVAKDSILRLNRYVPIQGGIRRRANGLGFNSNKYTSKYTYVNNTMAKIPPKHTTLMPLN